MEEVAQHRDAQFAPQRGRRKSILKSNIADTSRGKKIRRLSWAEDMKSIKIFERDSPVAPVPQEFTGSEILNNLDSPEHKSNQDFKLAILVAARASARRRRLMSPQSSQHLHSWGQNPPDMVRLFRSQFGARMFLDSMSMS